jgi:threonine/homoserine/homoserine lactone efflux protein
MHWVLVFLLGWCLSFLGQLPLGTTSMTVTQIAVQEDFAKAWKYSFGVALVEVLYLRVVLSGVNWMENHRLFFLLLGWVTVAVFLVLGAMSFLAARHQHEDKKALLLTGNLGRFWLGVSMSALNPAQIPFWVIWTSYFMDLRLLHPNFTEFNLFALGAGTGTVSGLLAYTYGGNWLISKMNTSNKTLNKIMGAVFVLAALAQLYRLSRPQGF